jgi:hypothetical protein
MNGLISAVITASALIFGVFLPREEAVAQTVKDLVGTWTLVSLTLEKDRAKTDLYGPIHEVYSSMMPTPVSMCPSSQPMIAPQVPPRKTRLSCRAVLPSLVLKRWMRQPRSLPSILRTAYFQTGSEPTVDCP